MSCAARERCGHLRRVRPSLKAACHQDSQPIRREPGCGLTAPRCPAWPNGASRPCRSQRPGRLERQAARRLGVPSPTANRRARRRSAASTGAGAAPTCSRSLEPSAPDAQPRDRGADPPGASADQSRSGTLAGILGWARSSIWSVPRRLGASRRPRTPRPITRRFEWERPGRPFTSTPPGRLDSIDAATAPMGDPRSTAAVAPGRFSRMWPSTPTAATPTSSSTSMSRLRPAPPFSGRALAHSPSPDRWPRR